MTAQSCKHTLPCASMRAPAARGYCLTVCAKGTRRLDPQQAIEKGPITPESQPQILG